MIPTQIYCHSTPIIFDGILSHVAEKIKDFSIVFKVAAIFGSMYGGVATGVVVALLFPTIPLALVSLIGLAGFVATFHIVADMMKASAIMFLRGNRNLLF